MSSLNTKPWLPYVLGTDRQIAHSNYNYLGNTNVETSTKAGIRFVLQTRVGTIHHVKPAVGNNCSSHGDRFIRPNNLHPLCHFDFLLTGLVRCGKCGSMMTSSHATGRNQKYPYYVCTKRDHGEKADCDAPYIPADLLDKAVIERCIALSVDEPARDRIVRSALDKADDRRRQLDVDIESIRQQTARIAGEINQLLAVLKMDGAAGIDSVGDELRRLETEKKRLTDQIVQLEEQRNRAKGVSDQAHQFLENWRNVAQLFEHTTVEEKRAVIRLYVEVIEITADDGAKAKQGGYSLVLFPEAVVQRDDCQDRPVPNGQDPAEAGSLLSAEGLVRSDPQEAPRVERVSSVGSSSRCCTRVGCGVNR